MYNSGKKYDDDESSDSDWEVETFEGTPQEYMAMLDKRKDGYVSEEVMMYMIVACYRFHL
jgi:hypothetical protein